ncbi:P-loop containing nucleoside triphosphate hydrolase protein [Fomitiporia mediterranea MF3/22]|uniref:P-loop containing nucleoside triphosphate hydrolase protein n=1 Tax=Fomitiporia mediterranea (strain MF3/22) TaxID=694068 RepID=UPI0004408876|nr:P-loop containing nucleoside triphosphate hydrolase protein [Fomitiporia mediterranea MF3/22]EJD05026.1 P-loop containing nucleoside triphosphate hydrolase protein [Fomitiporia mediterranea MF3/22]
MQAGRFLKQIQAYKSRFEPLIHAEQEAEEEVIKRRLSTWSLRRLKEEGYCMTDLKGFWLLKSKDDRSVAGFRLSPGVSLPPHVFTYGSQVFVSRLDPLKDEPRRGSVVKVKPEQIDLAFDETFDDLPKDFWRLDLGTSNIAFQRMYDAINKLAKDPEMIEKDPQNLSDNKMYRLEGTGLRDVLLKSFAEPKELQRQSHHLQDPGEQHYLSHDQLEHDSRIDQAGGALSENQLIQSWARRYRQPDPVVVEGDPPLNHLNASQIRAMAMMIGERISLIQGPPGTGKTKTIVETVKLLKGHFEVPHPILVCTFTNVAIDNLLEGFANGGLKPLRVGNEGSAKPELQEYMFDEQFDGHPKKAAELDPLIKEYEELDSRIRKLRKDIKALEDEKPTNWIEKRENMKLDMDRKSYRSYILKARARLLRESIFYDICTKADVICTTSIRSASYYLQTMDFPVVFLDEASMSTEPASLIPLMKGCKHLALIGDHKQLPPVVVSRDAQQGELDVSLFERLISEGDVPSVMLDVQYRMHPGISKFPSMEFYDTMLLDGTVHAGEVIPSLMPLSSSHLVAHPETGHRPSVIFIDHEGPEATKSRSRVNWTEGYIICSIVEDLLRLNPDLLGEDIGVIAPYKSQMNLLTRLLKKDDEVRDHFKAHLGDRALEVPNIEVKTVDGFEGREKQAIIFSTVRNNQFGHIGFLADRRRLNVGLTRAKRALFVVGSMSTLERGKYGYRSSNVDVPEQEFRTVSKGALAWRNYAQHLVEQNLVYRLRGDDLVKVLLPYTSFADRALRYFC